MKPAETGAVAAGSSVGCLAIVGAIVFVVMKKRKQKALDEAYGSDVKARIKARNENTKPAGFNIDKMLGENESNFDIGNLEANLSCGTAKVSQLTTSLSLSPSSPDDEENDGIEEVNDVEESIYDPKLDDPKDSLFASTDNNSVSYDQMAASYYHIVKD